MYYFPVAAVTVAIRTQVYSLTVLEGIGLKSV